MDHNAILFESLEDDGERLLLHLVEHHAGKETRHTWQVDALTGASIREAMAQDPFPRKGKATVWYGGLNHKLDSAEYTSKFSLRHGRSRAHFSGPCSKEFYERVVALANSWLPPEQVARMDAMVKDLIARNELRRKEPANDG
jgi:hypothetical protein